MYPLVKIGPFSLSSGGLCLLLAVVIGSSLFGRIARARGTGNLGVQADNTFYPVIIGAVIGARLWYGVFNWDLFGRTPGLFWAIRVESFAWPGALLVGLLFGYLWCRWRGYDCAQLADAAALALPVPVAIASAGLLLSGEAFGAPTSVPWAVPLFGTLRHPTQIYLALAALLTLGVLVQLARSIQPPGTLMAMYLGLHGLTLLLIEWLRADSLLLPGGFRAGQVVGLGLLLWAIWWLREHAQRAEPGIGAAGTSEVVQP